MEIYTNLVWPDDPYRTGQQLYRRPAPRLAAFTVGRSARASRPAPAVAAIVYLPLHRTQTLAVTGETLAFGFRAASIGGEAGGQALAQVADLDLLQARRHAAILAGNMLAGDLAALRALAGDSVVRGVTAVERDWAHRSAAAKGRAVLLDCGLDLPAASLAEACVQARISVTNAATCTVLEEPAASEQAAALAVQRALILALVTARHLGRYRWEGTLHADEIMAAGAWDCFLHPHTGRPSTAADAGVTVVGQPGHGVTLTGA